MEVTTKELAYLFDKHYRSIWLWVERGWIEPIDRDASSFKFDLDKTIASAAWHGRHPIPDRLKELENKNAF